MGFEKATIVDIYRRIMCRRSLYRVNKALYLLSLNGIGIGNWKTPEISGEYDFLKKFCASCDRPIVVDVGANVGKYSDLVRRFNADATIYAFEPHPETFKGLARAAEAGRYTAINKACSDLSGKALLFDHEAEPEGTEHASLVAAVIEDVHDARAASVEVDVTTIDEFVKERSIDRIHLLKIDVEGHEKKVLEGAAESIRGGMVDLIHFEFTEASMVSRVFLKDFLHLLPDYDLNRMLPDGLAPLGPYFPPIYEIFAYQNIVAIKRGMNSRL
jgi:FkbM family methyltransferase